MAHKWELNPILYNNNEHYMQCFEYVKLFVMKSISAKLLSIDYQ